MSTHRARHLAGATLVAAVVAASGTATASVEAAKPPPLTPFANNKIVVQQSIGGITLGTTRARAGRAFPSGTCGRSGCSYQSPRHTYTAYFNMYPKDEDHRRPYVGRVTLGATEAESPIRRLRTARGVGIGSTTAALKSAYPGLRGTRPYYFLDAGGRRTTFSISSGRVEYISISFD